MSHWKQSPAITVHLTPECIQAYYNCASCTSRVYHMIIMNRPFSTWGTFYGYQGGSNSLALFNTSTWQGQAHVVWGTDTCLYRFLTLQTQHVQYVSEVKTPYWFKTHRLSRPWQNATAPLGRKEMNKFALLTFYAGFCVIGSMFPEIMQFRKKIRTKKLCVSPY